MGILLSFSGIDGAGKSTQVKLLTEYLHQKNKKVLVTEEMFGYSVFKPLIKYLRTATKSPKGGPVTRNTKILYKGWFLIAFVDIWISYLFIVRRKLRKYDYVIADRFYTDIWANILYYGYSPQWAFELLLPLLPHQDIELFLVVNPQNVLSREDDFLPDYYFEQEIIYSQLRRLRRAKAENSINANLKPTMVFESIKKTLR